MKKHQNCGGMVSFVIISNEWSGNQRIAAALQFFVEHFCSGLNEISCTNKETKKTRWARNVFIDV